MEAVPCCSSSSTVVPVSSRVPVLHAVQDQPLATALVMSDGGSFSADYSASNVFVDDKSCYCSVSQEGVNIVARCSSSPPGPQNGHLQSSSMAGSFLLTSVVVKSPPTGFTSPLGQAIIFTSWDYPDLNAIKQFDSVQNQQDFERLTSSSQGAILPSGTSPLRYASNTSYGRGGQSQVRWGPPPGPECDMPDAHDGGVMSHAGGSGEGAAGLSGSSSGRSSDGNGVSGGSSGGGGSFHPGGYSSHSGYTGVINGSGSGGGSGSAPAASQVTQSQAELERRMAEQLAWLFTRSSGLDTLLQGNCDWPSLEGPTHMPHPQDAQQSPHLHPPPLPMWDAHQPGHVRYSQPLHPLPARYSRDALVPTAMAQPLPAPPQWPAELVRLQTPLPQLLRADWLRPSHTSHTHTVPEPPPLQSDALAASPAIGGSLDSGPNSASSSTPVPRLFIDMGSSTEARFALPSPVPGRYVVIKLLRAKYSGADNIDVQYIGLRGFTSAPCFASGAML